MSLSAESCGWTSRETAGFLTDMEGDDLINHLLARCGAIMEDASAVAILSHNGLSLAKRIAAVRKAAAEVTALVVAASVLLPPRG